MAIIDTDKAKPLTGCECVAATFKNISEFANRELPADFPKEFTDEVMSRDYMYLPGIVLLHQLEPAFWNCFHTREP